MVPFVLLCNFSNAQGVSYCKGLKNPTSFVIASAGNNANAQWYGYTGSKDNYTSTCNDWGMRQWGTVIPASQLATTSSGSSCTNGNSVNINGQSDYMNRFVIKGPGSDPLTYNHLSYLPPDSSYTSSIRLGNNCGGTHEAEMLCYEFDVVPQNALIFIWYALSLQNGQHSVSENPEFAIQIERQNVLSGTWQSIGGDTLCYIRPTPAGTGSDVSPFYVGSTGSHNSGASNGCNIYLPWNKVAINLNNYLYERVRIKIGAGDCSMSVHYACAYIAGECQPIEIKSSGCPAGSTQVVDTLRAPKGLSSYRWYKSNSGMEGISSLLNVPETVQFTPLTTDNSANHTYLCQSDDFLVTEGSMAGQYTNLQVFRCDMTSYMNPDIPIISKVYVSVNNTKPSMSIDTIKTCENDVLFLNKSFIPNIPQGVEKPKTRWWFHNGDVVDSAMGDSISYHFDSIGTYQVTCRSFFRDDNSCFSDSTYTVNVLGSPDTRNHHILASALEVCDSEVVVLRDEIPGSVRRDWIVFNDTSLAPDTVPYEVFEGDRNGSLAEFSHIYGFYKNPVVLRTYNGLYTEGEIYAEDTVWCTAYDTVVIEVFQHPELLVEGDTVVCNGQPTDITVSTETPGCTYRWYRHIGDNNQIAEGNNLQVMPYDDTCKYYVKVISTKQCVAWDSVNAYRVNPTLSISRHDMCEGDYVTLTADRAYSFSWSAQPPDSALLDILDSTGHGPSTITVSPKQTTVYTLVGHGTNDCNASPLSEQITIHPIPEATVDFSPYFVDSDNPVVTLTDKSPYSVRRVWYFNDGTPLTETTSPCSHNFGEVSADSVDVTLVAYNDLDCSDTLNFSLPVTQFTFYAPNAFTPERPDNNTFSIFTANEQENFVIFIYDRNGRQVYHSEDLHFKWDGNSDSGIKCPQGTYVYVIYYRRPGTEDIVNQKGTITLIR